MDKIKKLPIVRHLRWLYMRHCIWSHARYWLKEHNMGTGRPSEKGYDLLESIWRGEE